MKGLAPRPGAFAANWFWILVPVVLAATQPARANTDVLVSLDYQTDATLPGCPGADDFRRDVARQLGRDPFREIAPRRLVVRIQAAGGRIGGRAEWRDARDEWEGERSFASRNETCAEMSRAIALATAIQIQLLARLDQAQAPPPVEAKPPPPPLVRPAPPAAPPPPPVIAPPPEPRLAVDVSAGVVQDFGDSPALLLPRLAVTLGRPSAFGVRLAVNGLGPGAQVTRPEGSAEVDRFIATLELLRFFRVGKRLLPFAAAGVGFQEIGVRGTSAMPMLASAHATSAATGLLAASGGVAFALATRLALVAEADVLLFRPAVTVQIGSSDAARLDGVSLFVHGGVLARF